MATFSVWHWLIFLIVLLGEFGSPVLGIIRGVKNSSVMNAVASVFIPFYGLIYFLAAKRG